MKRLIRKAFGNKIELYHLTNWEGFFSIIATGKLDPWASVGAGIDGVTDRGALINKEKNKDYKDNLIKKNDDDMTEKEKTKVNDYLGRTFLLNSINSDSIDKYGNIAIVVSADEDALLPDNNDCPTCKTAKESLDNVGQCSIIGEITDDFIVGYCFYSGSGDYILYKGKEDFQKKGLSAFTQEDIELFVFNREFQAIEEKLNISDDVMDKINKEDITDKLQEKLKQNKKISDGYWINSLKNNEDETMNLMIEEKIKPGADMIVEIVSKYISATKRMVEELDVNITKNMLKSAIRRSKKAITNIILAGIEIDSEIQREAINEYEDGILILLSSNIEVSEENMLLSIDKYDESVGTICFYCENISEKVLLFMVEKYSYAIEEIISHNLNPSNKVLIEGIKRSQNIFEYMDENGLFYDLDNEVQIEVLKKDPHAIQYFIANGVSELDEEVKLAVVKENGLVIDLFFEKGMEVSELVQLEAVKQNTAALEYIEYYVEDVSPKVLELSMKNK